MWEHLKQEQKKKYKTLITNFASLSEAFSQKKQKEKILMIEKVMLLRLSIQNSKRLFSKRLFMLSVRILPIPPMMLRLSLMSNISIWLGLNPLVWTQGIKRLRSSRKIHSLGMSCWVKSDFMLIFHQIRRQLIKIIALAMKKLAREIATLRNQRIESSKALIKGFHSASSHVEAVYHVLMPTSKGHKPQIHVGETTYLPVDLDHLKILGSTTKKQSDKFPFYRWPARLQIHGCR